MPQAIVFDIETKADSAFLGRAEVLAELLSHMKAPGNCSLPETIKRKKDEALADKLMEAALSPITGRIVAIGVADLNDETDIACEAADDDERGLLERFSESITERGPQILCGYAVRPFDIPFVTARCALHDVALPEWWPHTKDFYRIVDAMDILSPGTRTHLSTWLLRFGLPGKTGSGADVAFMDVAQIQAYCLNDVRVERMLIRKIAPFVHAFR